MSILQCSHYYTTSSSHLPCISLCPVIVIGLEKTEYTGYEGEDVMVCVTVEEGGDMDSVPFDFVITSMPDTPLSAQPSCKTNHYSLFFANLVQV